METAGLGLNSLLVVERMNINMTPFKSLFYKPFDEAFVFHIYSSCSPTGIQKEPLSSQKYSVPQMIRFHILEALALAVPNAFTVAWYFLAHDVHLSVNTTQTQIGLRINFFAVSTEFR